MKKLVNIKKNIIKMAHYSHSSHVGSALSVVDILYILYSKIANITIENRDSLDRDKVILSKGHASSALYSTMAELGLLDKESLNSYYINGAILPGHLDKDSVPGIDCSSGSLGHGLSIGLGMALANKKRNIYVILGDGELNEGSIWEAVMLLGRLKLINLTIIIDKNDLQGFDETKNIIDFSKLREIFEGWGLQAIHVDGHNLIEIENSLRLETNKTKVIIAQTTKGKGISFMENQLKWHYKSPNDEELLIALKELDL